MLGLRNLQSQKEELVVFGSVGHLCGPVGPKEWSFVFLFSRRLLTPTLCRADVEMRDKKMAAHSDLVHNPLIMGIHLEVVHSFLFLISIH